MADERGNYNLYNLSRFRFHRLGNSVGANKKHETPSAEWPLGQPHEWNIKKCPPRFPSIKKLLTDLEKFSRLHHLFAKTTSIILSLLWHAMVSNTLRNSPSSILLNSDNRDSISRSARYIYSLLAARHLPSIVFPMKSGAQFFHHTKRECSK